MKNVADLVLSMYCDTVQEVTGNVEELHTIVDWKFICQIRRTDMQVGGGGGIMTSGDRRGLCAILDCRVIYYKTYYYNESQI